ncbi:unnamed protein product [Porites evermanni]|uniref:Uncharacterized protein n=1 Tax=Porites evermanni TaxID=104178 RepID=A0ABN8SS87_9CNID|nr:unnamed protein product [Porites evermanni]
MISSLNAVITVLLVCVYKMSLSTSSSAEVINHEYCVVGAGPGGLQIGFYLERAGRDYVIFERDGLAGAFYVKYPRHRKLISINKRHTGKTNKEFNMRHDWNSLLSDDESLLMTRYSKKFFPDADDLVRYLNDYATKLKLKVQYNTNIKLVSRNGEGDDALFHLTDQNGTMYTCKNVIMSSNAFISQSYSEMSVNPDDYEGQTVLIIGRGNSAFETAENIMGATNLIHMFARSRVRLSWETHYVGDLRAVNNGILDTYQLKSLDALLGSCAPEYLTSKLVGRSAVSTRNTRNSQLLNIPLFRTASGQRTFQYRATSLWNELQPALKLSPSVTEFKSTSKTKPDSRPKCGKSIPVFRPKYRKNYTVWGAGTNTHSIDLRKSAGGFIHGFRYTGL